MKAWVGHQVGCRVSGVGFRDLGCRVGARAGV